MSPATETERLFAALLVSCLLHAALVFLPYLGASAGISRPAAQGGGGGAPVRILDATLALESGPAAGAAADPADSAGAPDAAAHPIPGAEPRPAQDRTLGIGLLPLPAPSYYTTDQLTKRPRPTSSPRLDALETGPTFAPGTAILKLWIDELGDVVSVEVEKTDLPEAIFATVVAAFKSLHFVPGEINGRRVGSLMRIEVIYDDGTTRQP